MVAQCSAHAGFDSKTVYEIQLAVDEACSNIIEHAYGGEDQGNIKLTCEAMPGEFIVRIEDQGQAFDPQNVPKAYLDGKLSGHPGHGLGFHFMSELMDEVTFDFGSSGTLLTMIKRKEQA